MIAKDKNGKVTDESKDEREGFNLDWILNELGSFGKYQLILLLLLAFRDSFLSMCNFHYVFTAVDVPHRCYVPECDHIDSTFNASWTSFALPNETGSCFRMAPTIDNNTHTCSRQNFETSHVVPCEKIEYEDYNSVVAEFDLGCEPWKRTLIGTVHNLGLVFSSIISGLVSDKYGRKVVIVCSPLVVGTVGLIKSFSVSYWMLLILEFLETAIGYGSASMVLSLEIVSQKRRVAFSCLWDIFSNIGDACFGLIAWKVPYWRTLMRAIYAPLLVTVFYIFLVDEGVRWLLAHNKKDEAVKVLNKVAKYNNVTLSSKAKDMLTKITAEKSDNDKAEFEVVKEKHDSTKQLIAALRSRKMVGRVLLVSAILFCCTFVYNGAIINSGTISGNRYVNYAAVRLVSVPTRILTAFTLTRFGRKQPICCAYLLCALFFMASAFAPKFPGISLMLYLGGKMASSYGMFSISVVAMEVFPTTSRNSLFNMAALFGRLGSVLAPQSPLLEQYMQGLPSLVFGALALGPAVLILLMPDTSQVALPDDVSDAEKLDQSTVTEGTASSEEIPQKQIERV